MKRISLLILACCLPLFIAACGQGPQVAKVGAPAPDVSLVDLKGKTWTLSELKGQVVFVNFWATWCPPCVEEMPSMQMLHTVMPKNKFKMLAILTNDDPTLAASFAAKSGLTMPILIAPDNGVARQYGVSGVPETYIVDKQGVVREKFIGPAHWDSPWAIQMLAKYINQE